MSNKLISIITVNYNGKRLLKDFLESVFDINYPNDKYEVIVVDNGSTDGSQKYIRKNYPQVRLIESKKNLGFGGGNNLGIKHSKGDLVFLINNDTYVTKEAVEASVKCFNYWSTNKKIGAVSSKLIFFDSYIPLIIRGALFSDYLMPERYKAVNKRPMSRSFMRDKDYKQLVLIPFNFSTKDDLNFKIILGKTDKDDYSLTINNKLYDKGVFDGKNDHIELNISLNREELVKHRRDLIQNAGNFYFRDGSGRDRGVYVIKQTQYYELDSGQYEKDELIPAFNGAAVLLNKKALNDVGLFDDNFFMYYEDGDLSLRLMKKKWKIVFCPHSVIRHIHSASSKEFSDFFIYHTERNRLLMVFKHWPRIRAIKSWTGYIFRETIGVFLYYIFRGETALGISRIKTRLKVNASLAMLFVRCMLMPNKFKRKQIMKFL